MTESRARAHNLWERSAERWNEVADWVTANSLDLALAAVAAALVALALVALRIFGHRLIRDRDETISWRTVFGRALSKTGLFFISMAAIKLVSGQTDAPPVLQRPIDVLFIIAAAFQAAVWGRELILGFIEYRVGEAEEEQGRLASAIGIVRLLVTVTLFAIAIILILSNLGVNVTGLVAGLGIGGIAIGLAAQGIFSDLFAALSIIFDRPFRKGDTVTFGSPPTTGIVEHIGLKTTRIRSLGGEQIVVSNANLLSQQLQNWALLERRRVVMQFGIIYQTPPEHLAQVPHEVKAILDRQDLAAFDRCHAFQFGASSIDFELVFHVESPSFTDMMQVRQELVVGMARRFAELGIDFAYPTQTGFLAGPDGKAIDPREVPAHVQPGP